MAVAVNAILVLLPLLYAVLVIAYARIFTRRMGPLAVAARGLLIGTTGLHLLSALLRGIEIGSCPVATPAEFCSLVALSIALIYLALEIRIDDRTTGIFNLLAALLLQFGASVLVLSSEATSGPALGVMTSLHAATAILGLSAIVVASIYGLLYLGLYAAIKWGRFGLFYERMPSLELLSALNTRAAGVAFLALTLTLICGYSGMGGKPSIVERIGAGSPEVLLTWIAWLLYGSCLAARRVLHVGGKRLAYTTILGLVLVLSILVVALIGEGFHG